MRIVLSLALASVVLASCGGSHDAPVTAPDPDPVSVETAVVERVTIQEPMEAVGSVAARETAVIAARIPAYIQAVRVSEGDYVKPGRTLVELDGRDLRAAVAQAEAARDGAESGIVAAAQQVRAAEAQLELARATFQRFDGLAKKNSVTQQELDETTARVRQAEAAVSAAKAQQAQAEASRARSEAAITSAKTALSYSSIDSPVAGRVTKRLLDPGSMAAPGMPILEIEKAGAYRLEVAVPESQAWSLKVGETLPIRIDALGDDSPSQGRIAEIVPSSDRSSRTVTVKITLPSSASLRSGMFGRATIPGPESEAAAAPAASIVERGQVRHVFVIQDGRAIRRQVQLGAALDGAVTVQSGLEAGDEVVLNPERLQDGARVLVSRTSR